MDGGGGGGGGKKARKARTIFSEKQLQELESMFEVHKYLSVQDRMELAKRMKLSDTQVKTWYQNRRTKWKRQAQANVDLLHDQQNLAAAQSLLCANPWWMSQMQNPLFAQQLLPIILSNPAAVFAAARSNPTGAANSSFGDGSPTTPTAPGGIGFAPTVKNEFMEKIAAAQQMMAAAIAKNNEATAMSVEQKTEQQSHETETKEQGGGGGEGHQQQQRARRAEKRKMPTDYDVDEKKANGGNECNDDPNGSEMKRAKFAKEEPMTATTMMNGGWQQC